MTEQQPIASKTKPVRSFRNGRLDASLWLNTAKSGEAFHTVRFTRSYRTEAGTWSRSSISLRPSDVAAIIDLANRILAESPELKKPENQASE